MEVVGNGFDFEYMLFVLNCGCGWWLFEGRMLMLIVGVLFVDKNY